MASVHQGYDRFFPVLTLFVSLVTATPSYAVLSGSLETKFQSDSYFDSGNYIEQWLTLDSRSRANNLSWGVFASYDDSGSESLVNLHRLYVEKSLFENNLSAKAGRFERIDAAGFYTLDGAELRWQGASKSRWNWFVGKPRRSEVYLFSSRGDDSVDQPDSKYLAGLNMSQPLNTDGTRWLDLASFSLGTRYHWSGANALKLDSRFSANWLPMVDFPPVELDSAMVLNTDNFSFESFNAQANIRLEADAQLWLKGRRFDPPDDPVTFKDRYYRYYGKGWQTVLEAGYQKQANQFFSWRGGLRSITREQGLDGIGMDFLVDWSFRDGALLQSRIEWLESDAESAGGFFLGYQRPVNSRLLLQINAAVRKEHNRMDSGKSVIASELKLDWMWTRDLHLTSMLELARSDDRWDKYNQVRFGLRLIYLLPIKGSEDYR